MQENNGIRWGKNLAVVAVIAALCGALLLLSLFSGPRTLPADPAAETPADEESRQTPQAEAFLIISVAGRQSRVEPLDQDRDVEIAQPNGCKNVIHITRNGFHMASSTCENQLCIGQGEVTVDNYTRRILGPYVLCLPNQVELQLVIPGATPSPDAPDI